MRHAIVVENDARKGFQIWKRILPIVHLWTYQQIGPVSDLAIYRSMLNSWGLHGGYCRDPFFPLDEKQESKAARVLGEVGLERSGARVGRHIAIARERAPREDAYRRIRRIKRMAIRVAMIGYGAVGSIHAAKVAKGA